MFGAKYSRMKFWLISMMILFLGSFARLITDAMGEANMRDIIPLLLLMLLVNVLANRIRDFGSNPWLALWAIIPFVGLFQALYYGCKQSGETNPEA